MRITKFLPRLLILTAVATTISACSFIPEYARTDIALPARYGKGSVQSPATQKADGIITDWKHFYRDPRTAALIELALKNNHDLRLAALNAQKVQARYQIQRSQQWPAIDASISQTRQRPDASADMASFEIGITSYELDLFGRVRNLKKAALSDYFSHITTGKQPASA